MRHSLVCLFLGWAFLLAATPAHAQKKNPQGKAVLLLSGGQREHHGYRDQANGLAHSLEETGLFRVTIGEDAALLETDALSHYQAIILLTDRRDPEFRFTEKQQRRLVEFVQDQGKALVSIHGADNAAPDWLPEMRAMLGGVFSHDTSGGRPDGKTRKGDYRIQILQPEHPACAGLLDFDLKDELYYHMQMEPGIVPVAGVTVEGKDWPVAWAKDHGKGRVFHTVFGHRDFGPDKHDPLHNPELFKLVSQGLSWAVSGPVSEAAPSLEKP